MRKISSLLLLAFLLIPSVFASRQVVNLNRGWQFTPGWEVRPGVQTEVNLPHTWNYDALAGKPDYYRGMGNYVKTIDVPAAWKAGKVFIRFKGAATVADLYVNGKHIGQHKGGFTAFAWDITPNLTFGGRNTIWVRVNNAVDLDVMPLVGDFNMYGGLYRDVELILTPLTHISLGDYGSEGVYVTPTRVTAERADINITALVEGTPGDVAEVRFMLRDAGMQLQDSLVRRIKIGDKGRTDIAAIFAVNEPRLWNGVDDPHLYNVDVTVNSMLNRGADDAVDNVVQYFGLRRFEVDNDNNFLLNGKPLKIRGVVRHQDWADAGSALFPENHVRDIELMTDMGVNAVRLATGPHDPYFVSLCDRAGIIVWSELPFMGPGVYRDKGFNDSDAFRDNGKRQLREMVFQLYNHPSIAFWGLYNELVQRGDDPVDYLKELNALLKEDDPSRLTVAASNQDGPLNFVTDLIGFNQFMGWTSGMPGDFDGWGIQLRREWPKLLSGVSGYGAGAGIYQHSDTIARPSAAGAWHPEQWQCHLHETYWKTIDSKNYFWGTFVWSMFDYGVASRTDGQRPGVSDYGLVTFDRRVPKDAYYFYKANWNEDDPFVYITQRRWIERTGTKQSVKVYSNNGEVDLIVNGVSAGKKPNDGHGTFTWADLAMKKGRNVIEAVGSLGQVDRITVNVE